MEFNNFAHMQMVEENIRRNNELLHQINMENDKRIRELKNVKKKGIFERIFRR